MSRRNPATAASCPRCGRAVTRTGDRLFEVIGRALVRHDARACRRATVPPPPTAAPSSDEVIADEREAGWQPFSSDGRLAALVRGGR